MVNWHGMAWLGMSRHGCWLGSKGRAGVGHAGEGGVIPLSRGAGLTGIGAAGGWLGVALVALVSRSCHLPDPDGSECPGAGQRAGQPPGTSRGSAGLILAR